MYLIDTNALVLLLIGLIDTKQIAKHKRTTLFDEEDFWELVDFIGTHDKLVVLPNVWTEVDNLLNNFSGELKYPYIQKISSLIRDSSETYLSSEIAIQHPDFYSLGITDSLLLEIGKECDGLITSDSALSDRARARGLKVYDLVAIKNKKLEKY